MGAAPRRIFIVDRPSPPCRRELAAGAVDAYEVQLEAGQYLHFRAVQRGLDVAIDVLAPGRRLLFVADSPNGNQGPEDVHLVAQGSGVYWLEVHAVHAGARGAYDAEVAALRAAGPADCDRAAAQQAARQAVALETRGSLRQAVERYEQALRLWQGLGELEPQAVVLCRLGRLYLEHRDYDAGRDAVRVFQSYLEVATALSKVQDQAVAQNDLGLAESNLGEFAQARDAYQSALVVWSALRDGADEAATRINLGRLLLVHGDSWQALDQFRRARELAHAGHDAASEANAWNGMGWVYGSLADWQRARDAHRTALALIDRSPGRPHRVATLTQLGRVESAAGNQVAALAYLRRALQSEPAGGPARNHAVTLSSIAACLLRLHDEAHALPTFQTALGLFAHLGAPLDAAVARVGVAQCELGLNRPAAALADFDQALATAERQHDPGLAAVAQLGMARAEAGSGHPAQAREHGEAGLRLAETLRSAAMRLDLRGSFITLEEGYFDLVIDSLMALAQTQPASDLPRQALDRSEQSRSRRLLDALAARRTIETGAGNTAGAGGGLTLGQRWAELNRSIDELDLERRNPALTAATRATVERELRTKLDAAGEIEARVAAANPPAEAAAVPGREAAGAAPRPGMAQGPYTGILDQGSLLLEYYLAEPHGFLWVMAADGTLRSFELPGQHEIEARVRQLLGAFARTAAPPTPAAAADLAARWLSHTLLAPASGLLGVKRLVIAASGALQYLPFAALPDPGGSGKPLALRHQTVYIPSLPVVAELRRRAAVRQPAHHQLAVIADPVFGPSDPRVEGPPAAVSHLAAADTRVATAGGELPRLASTLDEARDIVNLLPGERPLLRTGFDATRELVTGGDLADYRFLHFATHGTAVGSESELSAIALSGVDRSGAPRDGYLRAHDLANLRLNADLVGLSACATALGPEIDREGMFGLSQAFLAAGARRVLVSLWNVGDRSTMELMRRFYSHLLQDKLPAVEALRLAQIEMRRQPQWQDPFHWAGFVLEGDWQ